MEVAPHTVRNDRAGSFTLVMGTRRLTADGAQPTASARTRNSPCASTQSYITAPERPLIPRLDRTAPAQNESDSLIHDISAGVASHAVPERPLTLPSITTDPRTRRRA